MGTSLRLPNAFAASALMMALSTLLVTMHVDIFIRLGSFSTYGSVSSCVTPSTMSFVMGLYSLLSSAVYFCPDGYIFVVMYGNLPLSVYVFYIQMIEY
jgi:hypothetical protein